MNVLITGANGLLGQKLVKLISEEGDFDVIATSKGRSRFSGTRDIIFESLDITYPERVVEVFKKYQPDFVINTAAMTNVDQCEEEKKACREINVNAVSSLLKASEEAGSFFIQLSTDFIFDGKDGPYTEAALPHPLSYYGESKLASEVLVRGYEYSWAIVRTVLVYGVSQNMSRSNIILWVKQCLETESPIQVVNDQFRTPTLAEDLAMGCNLIIKNRASGIFNISGLDLLTPYQMALRTADFFGLDKSLISETNSREFRQTAERPARTGFIIDRARENLGYHPHTFEEGIEVLANQLDLKS